MSPQFYMQFADPNNWMSWMNPAEYMTYMNPASYMAMMNPAFRNMNNRIRVQRNIPCNW